MTFHTIAREEFGTRFSSRKKRQWRQPEKRDHLRDMRSTPIRQELRVVSSEKVPTFKDVPNLHF